MLDETEVQVHQILYLEVLLLTVEVEDDEVLQHLEMVQIDEVMLHLQQMVVMVLLIDDEVEDDVPMQQHMYDELDERE